MSSLQITVMETVRESWEVLRNAWDELHPDNPVEGADDEDP